MGYEWRFFFPVADGGNNELDFFASVLNLQVASLGNPEDRTDDYYVLSDIQLGMPITTRMRSLVSEALMSPCTPTSTPTLFLHTILTLTRAYIVFSARSQIAQRRQSTPFLA